MDIVEEAFSRLYPDRAFNYEVSLKYSGKFKNYNANLRMRGRFLNFGLSREWKSIDREIKIGLIQELLLGVFKDKKNSLNIDLYNTFIKNLHLSVEKTKTDPVLEDSFERINSAFFNNLLEKPNLTFGKCRRSVLGNYSYQTDTITFSLILMKDMQCLDYVMYHELLHKLLKYTHTNGRSYHHTSEFKRLEKKFPNQEEMEQRLRRLVSLR